MITISNSMRKIQINYLYSSFVFVLIALYSLFPLPAKAGFISYTSYSINIPGLSYSIKNRYRAIQPHALANKSYTENLLHSFNGQENCIPLTKNKLSISLPADNEQTGLTRMVKTDKT
jgi:hypothetical protein